MTSIHNRPILDRFHLILRALPVGRPTTIQALATDLGFSYKTISRDLDFLQNRWLIPITRDNSGVMLRAPIKRCPACSSLIPHH